MFTAHPPEQPKKIGLPTLQKAYVLRLKGRNSTNTKGNETLCHDSNSCELVNFVQNYEHVHCEF